MKKINNIINEEINNFILLEYGGFVDGWQKLVDYIYKTSLKICNNFLQQNNINLNDTSSNIKLVLNNRIIQKKLYEELDNYYFEMNETQLNSCNIFGIKNLIVVFSTDRTNVSAFSSSECKIDSDGKLKDSVIIICPYFLFTLKEKIKDILYHELTHMYEFMMICKQNDFDIKKARSESNNHYYNISNNIVDEMSYYLSNTEINANISALAYSLRRNKINKNNYAEFIKKSAIYKILNKINQFKNDLNDNNNILDIIEFIKLHPEHCDMFPKIKSKNILTYKKKLLNILNKKEDKINKKINKVIGIFLTTKR